MGFPSHDVAHPVGLDHAQMLVHGLLRQSLTTHQPGMLVLAWGPSATSPSTMSPSAMLLASGMLRAMLLATLIAVRRFARTIRT